MEYGMAYIYTLDGVRDQLNDLKKLYESGHMKYCTNYIPIRLVAIIEQFCRVAYKHNNTKHGWRYRPVAMPILIDIFQQFKPDIKYAEFDSRIREYRAQKSAKLQASTGDCLNFKSAKDVCELVKFILGEANNDTVEWIHLCMLSFQNLKDIKDKLGVSFPAQVNERCNKLFGIRHAVAHTTSDHQVGQDAFAMVDSMFDAITTEVGVDLGDE